MICLIHLMVHLSACISFIFFLVACGKNDFPDYSGDDDHITHSERAATFMADFRPLNPQRSSFTGTFFSWIKEQQIYVRIVMKKGPKRTRFQQFIHRGSNCPGPSDDSNADGDLDFHEVLASSGSLLVPLDKSLRSQVRGNEWFPVSGNSGTYYYSSATSLKEMISDLKKRDPYPFDSLSKLKANESLSLGKKVVVIYGTETDPLFPIACAEITEVIAPYLY